MIRLMDNDEPENFEGIKALYDLDIENLENNIDCTATAGPSNMDSTSSKPNHYEVMNYVDTDDSSGDEILIRPEEDKNISFDVNCDINLVDKSLTGKDSLHLTLDIKVPEEINDDPNNNWGCMQSFQKQKNCGSDVGARCNESPKPGCKQNLWNDQSCFDKTMEEEANMIHMLLPKLTYKMVRKVLFSNNLALNRVELTLWDLLPYKRPRPQFLSKRRLSDDDRAVKYKKSLSQVPNTVTIDSEDTDEEITSVYDSERILSTEQEIDAHDLSENSTFRHNSLQKRIMGFAKNNGNTLSQCGILRPARFNVNNSATSVNNNTNTFSIRPERPLASNKLILAPSKLADVPASHSKNQTYNGRPGKYNKILNFAMKKNCPSNGSAFLPDSTNSVTTSSKMHCYNATSLNNYMSYLQTCQNTKKQYMSSDHAQSFRHNEVRSKKVLKKPNFGPTFESSKDLQSAMDVINKDEVDTDENIINAEQASVKRCNSDMGEKKQPCIKECKGIKKKRGSLSHPIEPLLDRYETNSVLPQNIISSDPSSTPSSTAHLRPANGETSATSINCMYDQRGQRPVASTSAVVTQSNAAAICDRPSSSGTNSAVGTARAKDEEEEITLLLGIFPDAANSFLKASAEVLLNEPDLMKSLIQNMMENPSYPTRDQYLAMKKIAEQQKQYTTNFKVEKFLEVFPNPFSHFENPDRKCDYNEKAVEFLSSHFRGFNLAILQAVYTKEKYNLTLTVQAIKAMPGVKGTRCNITTLVTDDIPMMQEFAFISYKEQIEKYFIEKKARDERAFAALKRRNALLECQCCYEECMPNNCATCDDAHVFCHLCIKRGTETRLSDGNTTVPCFVNCDAEISLSTLQKVLPSSMFTILLNKRQEAEVLAAGLEGLVSCPFCHFASIPPPDDRVFTCLNSDCMKQSCRLCKKLNHLPAACVDIRTTKARLTLEEKMTEALVRKCYNCSRPFYKLNGCNKISCPCGALMCYICNKAITGYEHFGGVHNAAQKLPGFCPLWSDNDALNKERVVTAAQQVVQEIQNDDPDVVLNANHLF